MLGESFISRSAWAVEFDDAKINMASTMESCIMGRRLISELYFTGNVSSVVRVFRLPQLNCRCENGPYGVFVNCTDLENYGQPQRDYSKVFQCSGNVPGNLIR